MGLKTLELTIISAKDLKNVNLIGKMDPYVVVYLSDNPTTKQKTPVHQDAGTDPSWNYTVRFTVDDNAAASGKCLIFKIKHDQFLGADKDLGEVIVPLKELFDGVKGRDPTTSQFLAYQVKRAAGKAKGEFKFSYKILDSGQNPNSGYGLPAKQSQSACGSSCYPPGPVGYPAASGQPYRPPQSSQQGAGYGYPPPATAQYGSGGVYPPPSTKHGSDGAYPPPQQGPPPATAVPYAAPGYPQQQPGYGYPPPPQGAGYGYAPPPQGAGYGYPQQGAYPPQGGYPPAGYPGPQMQNAQKPKKKKNNMGLGLGAGLIGGALGGLLLGEVVDDAFDSGFDDGGFDGGFDF